MQNGMSYTFQTTVFLLDKIEIDLSYIWQNVAKNLFSRYELINSQAFYIGSQKIYIFFSFYHDTPQYSI